MSLIRKRAWLIFLIMIIIVLTLAGTHRLFIEKYYTYGIYPAWSRFLRIFFGWSPISIGDLFYFLAFVWIVYQVIRYIRALVLHKIKARAILRKLRSTLVVLLAVYVIFMVFWGMNYSRKGIAYQLQLPKPDYEISDLMNLQKYVLQKVNESKSEQLLSGEKPLTDEIIFQKSVEAYRISEKQFPFLKYRHASIKSSLYGGLGNALGFTGYYNPFTGEAQVNTTVPRFLLPSITCHEMAHQLGYAKENEANFVGFIVAQNAADPVFRYSAYLDIFMYANSQLRAYDSTMSNAILIQLHPEVKKDIKTWSQFNLEHQSVFEPFVRWLYGRFLKLNQQPQGIRSYNEVVSMLIAYYKKNGTIP